MPARASKNQPQLLRAAPAGRDLAAAMSRQEGVGARRRRVEHDRNGVVARLPRRLEELAGRLLVERRDLVAQLVQRLAQRRAPGLVPLRRAADAAAAVLAPAVDAVDAAPGGVLDP